jgi:hypothetical protein
VPLPRPEPAQTSGHLLRFPGARLHLHSAIAHACSRATGPAQTLPPGAAELRPPASLPPPPTRPCRPSARRAPDARPHQKGRPAPSTTHHHLPRTHARHGHRHQGPPDAPGRVLRDPDRERQGPARHEPQAARQLGLCVHTRSLWLVFLVISADDVPQCPRAAGRPRTACSRPPRRAKHGKKVIPLCPSTRTRPPDALSAPALPLPPTSACSPLPQPACAARSRAS